MDRAPAIGVDVMTIDLLDGVPMDLPGTCPQCGGPTVVAEPSEPAVGIMEPRMACDPCRGYVDEMETP